MAGLLTPKPCMDCGGDPVFHRLTRWSIVLESLLSIFSVPGEKFSRVSTPITDRVFNLTLPRFFLLLEKVGLGTTTYEVDDRDFKYVTHVLWEEANKRGIAMRRI